MPWPCIGLTEVVGRCIVPTNFLAYSLCFSVDCTSQVIEPLWFQPRDHLDTVPVRIPAMSYIMRFRHGLPFLCGQVIMLRAKTIITIHQGAIYEKSASNQGSDACLLV